MPCYRLPFFSFSFYPRRAAARDIVLGFDRSDPAVPRDEELPIIRAFYDFVLWLNPKIAKFPRDQRFSVNRCC